jgi:hypothetical protein
MLQQLQVRLQPNTILPFANIEPHEIINECNNLTLKLLSFLQNKRYFSGINIDNSHLCDIVATSYLA